MQKAKKEVYLKLKANESESSRKEYLQIRRDYRNLIEYKKMKKEKETINRINKDISNKSFWNVINVERRIFKSICEEIKDNEWINHFKKQLEGKSIKKSIKENSRIMIEKKLIQGSMDDIEEKEMQ